MMPSDWAQAEAKEWLDSDDHVLPWAETISESVLAAVQHKQTSPLDALKPSTETRQMASLAALLDSVREESQEQIEKLTGDIVALKNVLRGDEAQMKQWQKRNLEMRNDLDRTVLDRDTAQLQLKEARADTLADVRRVTEEMLGEEQYEDGHYILKHAFRDLLKRLERK